MLNRLLILGAKTDYSHRHCTFYYTNSFDFHLVLII